MNGQAASTSAGNYALGVFSCPGSEIGRLGYVTLGNSAGAMTNVGSFQNLLPAVNWLGTAYFGPASSVAFDQSDGTHGWASKMAVIHAMAVRDGDVPAIPESGTYALMLVGLALRVARVRRPAY